MGEGASAVLNVDDDGGISHDVSHSSLPRNSSQSSLEHDTMKQLDIAESSVADVARLHIDHTLFEIDFDALDVHGRIGSGGSSAVVFKATWAGYTVAFKCFKLFDFMDQGKFDEFEKEVSLLASLSHPNVLVFYGATIRPPRVGIVMEFCPHGDLTEYCLRYPYSDQDHPFPVVDRLRVLSQVCVGMQYLHSKNVIHRDLKGENVLLTTSAGGVGVEKDSSELIPRHDCLVAKIMDFGISLHRENQAKKTMAIGTSKYMAPEVVLSPDYDCRVDRYSFGIMAFEVMTGNFTPFGNTASFNIQVRVANDPTLRPDFQSQPLNFPRDLREIIQRCWNHDPSDRPGFALVQGILDDWVSRGDELSSLVMLPSDEQGEDGSNSLLSACIEQAVLSVEAFSSESGGYHTASSVIGKRDTQDYGWWSDTKDKTPFLVATYLKPVIPVAVRLSVPKHIIRSRTSPLRRVLVRNRIGEFVVAWEGKLNLTETHLLVFSNQETDDEEEGEGETAEFDPTLFVRLEYENSDMGNLEYARVEAVVLIGKEIDETIETGAVVWGMPDKEELPKAGEILTQAVVEVADFCSEFAGYLAIAVLGTRVDEFPDGWWSTCRRDPAPFIHVRYRLHVIPQRLEIAFPERVFSGYDRLPIARIEVLAGDGEWLTAFEGSIDPLGIQEVSLESIIVPTREIRVIFHPKSGNYCVLKQLILIGVVPEQQEKIEVI